MYRYFILFIVDLVRVRADDAPTVTTAKGIIRGVRSEDGNMFMGIPYAKVDEANPFGISSPYPPFDKVFEADDDSSKCPQLEELNHTIVGDIDCLRLNIYTPTYANTTSRLGVLVFIYGGRFDFGFYGRHIYGPKYLVRHDIIFILMNYRVGPYGFMCLDIPEVPGNQGLRDQIMALRWIKSNVIAFGGDPNKVTISGNSAGATAADHHIYRDNNQENLYNQAILQSGIKPYSYPKPVKDAPIVLAQYYQFITDDVYQAIAFLATLPPKDIIIATTVLGLKYYPCVENNFSGIESYATVKWSEQKPMAANMSFLIGNNDDERNVVGSREARGGVIETNILGTYFDTQHAEFQGMSELTERYYLVGDSFGLDVAKLCTDVEFLYPSYRNMRELMKNDALAVYMYNFTYIGTKNYMHKLTYSNNNNSPKAVHADEIGYLFDVQFMSAEDTATDQLVTDKMTTLWTNFVKYGNPTPKMTELIDVKWKPTTPTSTFYCMNIDSNLTLTTSSFADKVMFWDLFYKMNGHLQI